MNMNRRQLVGGLSSLGFGALGIPAWAADPWPDKPLRVISGGSAGGVSDIFMRFIEEPLRQSLGQPLVILNMPGAGGTTAALNAARATDGHTFFISNIASNALSPLLYKNVKLDSKSILPGVARFCTLANGLVVRAETGISSATQLFEMLKSDNSKRIFGSGGAGTSAHLTCVMLAQRLGLEMVHIPYKGTADNLNGMLRGDFTFTIDNLPSFTPHIKAGKLKLLAVTTAQRSPAFPDVPTLQESGLANFDVFSWFGLSAAGSTPKANIDRVSAEVVKALADPAIVARFRTSGAEPAPLAAEAYSAFIESEVAKWTPLVKSAGLTVE